ncbi:MAG: extensin family protein [Xanthobacteraceae bacterium]|nr:extensin family protein [Xanthobacteraceae bacterium]
MAKLSRIGLVLAVPMAMVAGGGQAEPWLEPSSAISKPWDLPFIDGLPRQKRPDNLKVKAQRGPAGDSHHVPEAPAESLAASPPPPPASRVFPPPRPPAVTATTTPPTPTVTPAQAAPSTRATPPTQTAAATKSTVANDREVERQLKRELPKLQSPATPAATPAPAVPEQFACAERLAKIARYEALPARTGPNGCGAPDLVRLDSVRLRDKGSVAITPSPQIRCGMAVELAEWVREEVSPIAAAELGSPLASITGNDAYECRTRNHVKGAKISEHGRGNAFDLAAFRLKNGGVFNFTDPLVAKSFRERVRTAACGRFMTVLGPGSDAYHAQHIHLDMAERSSRDAKVCQWDVREVQVAARTEPPPAEPTQPEAAYDPDVTSPADVWSPIADVVSPPLPRRKPEALVVRAQLQAQPQAQTDGRRLRDGRRGERAEWSFRGREFRFRFRW